MKNLHLKILAVVIAVSLWYGLVSGEYQEFSVYAPLRMKNMQQDFVAVTPESHVNIVAKAPKGMMRSIDYDGIIIEVDVSKLSFGDTFHKINEDEVKVPSGVQVVRIEPEGINITVDKLVKKFVKVVPTFIGEPHPGFKVENVTVFPEQIEVEGATNKLEGISSIETKPVNLSARQTGITYSIGMKDTDGVKSTTPEQVEVYVSFRENIVEDDIKGIRVTPVNLPEGFMADASDNVTVRIRGRKDLLSPDNIMRRIKFYTDMSEVKAPGKYLLPVNPGKADGFEILKITPGKVRFTITGKEASE